MRLFSKGGVLHPIAIILTLQSLVLVAALIISSDLLDPILSSPKQQVAVVQQSEPVGSAGYAETRGRYLFPLNEILNETNSTEFSSDDLQNSLSDRQIEYVVGRGDTIASLWVRNGAPSIGATKAMAAVRDSGLDNFMIRKGESVFLTLNNSGDVVRVSKLLADGSTLVLTGSSTDGYEASLIKPSIEEQERQVAGTITNSFAASASTLGVSYSIIDDVVDLFSNRIEFSRAIQPGDSFTITFTEKRCKDTGKVVNTGPILSASFKRGEKLFAAIRHQSKSGSFAYFDENGQQGGNFFLRYPLKFTRISSTFSWARFHPVLQRNRPHHGVDFAAPAGTPVRAIGDGTIEYAGFKAAPGNMLRIKHSDRWTTVYMHLKGFAPNVKSGQRVSRGQIIGYVGSTGLSTGAHLHFELWENGKYVDPMAADLPNISQEPSGLPADFLVATLKDLEQKHEKVQLAFVPNNRNRG